MKSKFSKEVIVMGAIVIMSILGLLGASHMLKDISEEKYVSLKEINEIQVQMDTRSVRFIDTKESRDLKVNFHGKAMQEIKIVCEIENETLIIKTQPKPRMPLYEDVVLDIYIPKEYEKNLSINTYSSSVKMDSLSLESISYSTFSGKLEAQQLHVKKISMNTNSGGVEIKKIDTEDLAVKSGSGKILVAYNEFENQNVKIETSSGSITLELPSSAEFFIEAKTSSGNFQSDFPIKATDKKDIKGQIGTKNNQILLQTLSGSMKILKIAK